MIQLVETATEFELSPTLAANEMAAKRRAEGKEILHMGFGESPFPVPERLEKALAAAAHRKDYLPTSGETGLRAAVTAYYKDKVGLDTDKFDVVVAPGSKLNLYALQMSIKGDLLMPVPSWVSYAPQAKMLKTNVVKLPTILNETGYQIDPDVMRQTIKDARAEGLNPTKLILNYPSNPTGLTIPEENLKEIAAVCKEEDLFIISDEIYGFVDFNGSYRTIAAYAPERTAVTSGLSKHLSLGGWRVGVTFVPKAVEGLFGMMCNIASETWSCVPSPNQQASVEAYKGHADIEKHIADCTAIHKLMTQYISKGLSALGIKAPMTQGAFYNYPDFDPHREAMAKAGVKTSKDLADRLMEDYGLVTLPGIAFGAEPDVLTLRLSSCDYDGAKALKAYQDGATLDEAFIETYAPNVKAQVEAFGKFVASVTA